MKQHNFLHGESDIFVGKRKRLTRYLVCAMEGYFPVAIRTGPKSIAAVFRTGACHIGVSATVAASTSQDGGVSWSDPVEITPRWEDSRCLALGLNDAGDLIVAFWKAGLHKYKLGPDGWYEDPHWYDDDCLQDNVKEIEDIPALFVSRSSDNGKTWDEPRPYLSKQLTIASPFGRIITALDGTMIMSVVGLPRDLHGKREDMNILLRSKDGGRTWGDETVVARGYNETSYLFLPDGTMVGAARSESGHVAVLFSGDMGRTWSNPVQVTRDGEHPADLTLLESGKLLMTFGRRIRPMGCGALLSKDGGKSWNLDREILLAGDGVENNDLGYPSTVQIDSGNIVTLLYYASGSEMSQNSSRGWGAVSCQAIHYREEDIV